MEKKTTNKYEVKNYHKTPLTETNDERNTNSFSTLTVLEAESEVLFPHSVQIGLAKAKFTEARARTNMTDATWLLTWTACCKKTTKLIQLKNKN